MKRGRKPGANRKAIMELIESDSSRSWTPNEIKEELSKNGFDDLSVDTIRVTLGRIEGLERDDEGWKLTKDEMVAPVNDDIPF